MEAGTGQEVSRIGVSRARWGCMQASLSQPHHSLPPLWPIPVSLGQCGSAGSGPVGTGSPGSASGGLDGSC